jgi:hypothetical protein
MRIRLALLLGEGEVVDVVGLGQDIGADLDDLGIGLLVRLGEGQGRVLELEPVDEDEVGGAEEGGDGGLGLEGMAIRALGDDALDADRKSVV